jgi:hypothetical protein
MQNKKTSISDEKVKEILIDGINTGANYILNKTNFYEHIRTFFKIEKQRCLRLYDLHYNNAQIERNNIKTEFGIELEKEAVKRNILSKHDALEILTEIAQGKVKKVEGTLIIPSPSDRKGAIESIAKIEGWNAPTKSENTNINFEQPIISFFDSEDGN